VITHGVAQAQSLLADVLVAHGHRDVAVEDPHHPGTTELLAAHGLRPVPTPVDEDGIVVDRLAATGCRAVLVTPAHQFPLGVVLAPHRRRALLAWAADRDAVVIEDDYDAEHRYDRPAVRTLQMLDPERVAYVGSVSKVLTPAMRLGWLVAPHHLLPSLVDRKRLSDLGGSLSCKQLSPSCSNPAATTGTCGGPGCSTGSAATRCWPRWPPNCRGGSRSGWPPDCTWWCACRPGRRT
jgi:GntR family transcriptional regulator/MocR family aminotransferase